MPTWADLFTPDSNSPIMEQLTFFHDHSMVILILIITMIIYIMFNIAANKLNTRMILEGQEIETIWTILPAIMLIFIAVPSLRILYLMEESFSPSMTVKIIGHQWYWSYEYSNLDVSFDSFMIPENDLSIKSFRLLDVDNNTVMPTNINIRLLITAADVIHSWAIPSMGVKVDAVPGRLNQTFIHPKRPGMYFGQCSEICGANHSFMPICLETTSPKNFSFWVNSM